MDADDPPEYLTRAEACRYLKIGRTTLDRHIRNGLIVKHKIGRRSLLLFSEVRALPKPEKEKT